MEDSWEIQDKIADQLEALRSAGNVRTHLTRSVFDIDFIATVKVLAQPYDTLPILTANALRGLLAEQTDEAASWQQCLDFVEAVVPEVQADPDNYARVQTDITRNSFKWDQQRQAATAMLFFGTGTGYSQLGKAARYGLYWAYERASLQNVPLTSKLVGTFAVQNTFDITMRGDSAGEIVHPGLVLNTSIDAVMIDYDLELTSNGRGVLSRSLLLMRPDMSTGKLTICESSELGREQHPENKTPASLDDFQEVGELELTPDGVITVSGPDDLQAIIAEL